MGDNTEATRAFRVSSRIEGSSSASVRGSTAAATSASSVTSHGAKRAESPSWLTPLYLGEAQGSIAERIDELDAPHGVALYCMVGPRARKGESALLAAGHESVFHIEGGLAAWQEAGLPVEETK